MAVQVRIAWPASTTHPMGEQSGKKVSRPRRLSKRFSFTRPSDLERVQIYDSPLLLKVAQSNRPRPKRRICGPRARNREKSFRAQEKSSSKDRTERACESGESDGTVLCNLRSRELSLSLTRSLTLVRTSARPYTDEDACEIALLCYNSPHLAAELFLRSR